MKKQLLYTLYCCVLLCTACSQKHFYNEYQSVDSRTWKSTDTLKYTIDIKESNHAYAYSISVRHQKVYEFSNLWLSVHVQGPGTDTAFRFELPLFKDDGKPYGKSSGSLCTQTIPVTSNLPVHQKGTYTISIVQLMRKDPLDGIEDIGIIVDQK